MFANTNIHKLSLRHFLHSCILIQVITICFFSKYRTIRCKIFFRMKFKSWRYPFSEKKSQTCLVQLWLYSALNCWRRAIVRLIVPNSKRSWTSYIGLRNVFFFKSDFMICIAASETTMLPFHFVWRLIGKFHHWSFIIPTVIKTNSLDYGIRQLLPLIRTF